MEAFNQAYEEITGLNSFQVSAFGNVLIAIRKGFVVMLWKHSCSAKINRRASMTAPIHLQCFRQVISLTVTVTAAERAKSSIVL